MKFVLSDTQPLHYPENPTFLESYEILNTPDTAHIQTKSPEAKRAVCALEDAVEETRYNAKHFSVEKIQKKFENFAENAGSLSPEQLEHCVEYLMYKLIEMKESALAPDGYVRPAVQQQHNNM